jgi:RNA polymerase sigma-70 factor (ECF subfamily)
MHRELDKEAFTGLIDDNKRIIYKICNGYCADKTQRGDLAQEIVYQLWKSYSSYNTALTFSTWLYRIALNVAISWYRKEKKRMPQIPISEHLLLLEDEETEVGETETNLQLLQQFIGGLKEIDKSLILLYLDDKSYKEIAEITGISATNVSTRINRIKEKLRINFQNIKK